jgi:hypothetical protein
MIFPCNYRIISKFTLLTLTAIFAHVLGARHEDRQEGKSATQCHCAPSSDLNTVTSTIGSLATPSSGSPIDECSKDSPCHGDITFYLAGLGACGVTNEGSTEHIVALAHEFMGTQSNGNRFCGMALTINHGGKTVQATAQDKCMGCIGHDIDVSKAAFDALGIAESVGRTTADWWFN